jgi:GTP cyclohydrolase II
MPLSLAVSSHSTVRIRAKVEVPVEIRADEFMAATMYSFTGLCDQAEHLAVCIGQLASDDAPLIRIHSECLTGDVFSSCRCDCGAQLRESMKRMADEGGGIVIYLRQEGRGIGLYRKLDAYVLQDEGADTFAANRCLNLPEDARNYHAGAQMLRAMDVERVRLISNNPDKVRQLRRDGIEVVELIPTGIFLKPANARYLRAKAEHAGHLICLPDEEGP